MELNNSDIVNIIENIKQDILSTRNRVFGNANSELLNLYFRIGRIISENSNTAVSL